MEISLFARWTHEVLTTTFTSWFTSFTCVKHRRFTTRMFAPVLVDRGQGFPKVRRPLYPILIDVHRRKNRYLLVQVVPRRHTDGERHMFLEREVPVVPWKSARNPLNTYPPPLEIPGKDRVPRGVFGQRHGSWGRSTNSIRQGSSGEGPCS